MLAFLTSPHSSNQPFTPQKNFFFLELCLWARPLALGRLRSRANSPCSWTPGSSPFLLFLCFRHQVPPPVRGTRPSPRAPASAWPLTPVRAGPPAPRRTCGSGNAARPGDTSGWAGARVSLRRSFTGAAVTITTGARESWRRRRPGGGGGGRGRKPAGSGAPSTPRAPQSPAPCGPAGGRAPRTSPQRPSPRAGTEPAAEPPSARAGSPDSMARGELAGASAPPTSSGNPSASPRNGGVPGAAAGPGPGARPRLPPPPRGMAGR